MHTNESKPTVLTAVTLPVLLEDQSMPASQVLLHLLLRASCSTKETTCKELIRVAQVSMAREAGRGQHSSSCRSGEEVDHAVLCCKVQLKRLQALQKLRGGFAGQTFEGLVWICHCHLQFPKDSFNARTRICHVCVNSFSPKVLPRKIFNE